MSCSHSAPLTKESHTKKQATYPSTMSNKTTPFEPIWLYTNSTNSTGSDDRDDFAPSANTTVAAILAFSILLLFLSCFVVISVVVPLSCRTQVLPQPTESTDSQRQGREEKRRKRKEWVSKTLIVKEWLLPDATDVSTNDTKSCGEHSGTRDYQTTESIETGKGPTTSVSCKLGIDDTADNANSWGEDSNAVDDQTIETVESSIEQPAISRVACKLGTDDYDSFLITEQEPGCTICLNKFEAGDWICESNNLSCKHIYHRECMEGWLMKNSACPMCREEYLSHAV